MDAPPDGGEAGPAEIAVAAEPPDEVAAGEPFEVAFELLDEEGQRLERQGISISVELNRGQFDSGDAGAAASTSSAGVAQFELVIDAPDTGYVLTASSDHGALEGALAQTLPFDVVEGCDGEECDGGCQAGSRECGGACIAEDACCDDPDDPGAFGGGDGSPGAPYLICTAAHLAEINEDDAYFDRHFEVTADISLAASGFEPIGGLSPRFEGEFDGGGHVIRDLQIDAPTRGFVGLFGWIGGSGTVRNVVLGTSSSGILTVAGRDHVGALAGRNEGSIVNCHVDASAGSEVVAGDSFAGGLVGSGPGTIERSSANVDVNARDPQVDPTEASHQQAGGLIGINSEGGAIYESYATGSVEANSRAGGLAGINEGTIEDSYATGDAHVEGLKSGGLVGDHRDGSIARCYSTGQPTADIGSAGGLIGATGGSVSAAYWDEETSGTSDSIEGEAYTTADFASASSFPAWDFTTTWEIGTAPDGEVRPILQWQ